MPPGGLQEFGALPDFVPTNRAGIAKFEGLEPGQWLVSVDRVGPVVSVTLSSGESKRELVKLSPTGLIAGAVRSNTIASAVASPFAW